MWKLHNDSNGNINMIVLTAGDTPSFKINCNIISDDGDSEQYTPIEDDKFIFACKKNQSDKEPLFTIEIPNDTMILTFKEEDTKSLDIGKYIWEISLNNETNGYHCTFLSEKILKITTEVY